MPLVTFEGIDGSGKTTIIKMVKEYLEAKGKDVISTCEPYNKKLRGLIKSGSYCPEAELALFIADRIQHVKEVIESNLNTDTIILCDRYIDSTYAYQFGGNNIPLDNIKKIQDLLYPVPEPDRTYCLTLPANEAIYRASLRNSTDYDKYDCQTFEFYNKVKAGYAYVFSNNRKRFCIIDANKPKEEVFKDIIFDMKRTLFKDTL